MEGMMQHKGVQFSSYLWNRIMVVKVEDLVKVISLKYQLEAKEPALWQGHFHADRHVVPSAHPTALGHGDHK